MTTEYIAVPETSSVDAAIDALKAFEGSRALATIYLTSEARPRRVGAARQDRHLASTVSCRLERPTSRAPRHAGVRSCALFDKYNLITLRRRRARALSGIITRTM